MKQQKTVWNYYPLIAMVFLLMFASSCENDENLPDYASKIAGDYTGTVFVIGSGSAPCCTTVSKSSGQEVDLKIKIGSNNTPLDGIKVSSAGGDVYNLKYTDSSGSFTGSVDGNLLTYTLTAGSDKVTFSGIK